MSSAPSNILKLAPSLPAAIGTKSDTTMCLEALDDARKTVLAAEAEGKPITHIVVCMAAEFEVNKENHLRTQWVTTEMTGDLAAVGVMHLVMKDMFG